MVRLQFEMHLDEWCKKERGICSTFIDGKGRRSTSWWSSPSQSIDHADISYLRGRYGDGLTKHHVAFIKRRFKEEMKRFENYEGSKFREVSHLVGKVVRLHSESQPERYKLYMVVGGDHDYYSKGKVTLKTVNEWMESGLDITVYEEMTHQVGKKIDESNS